MSDYTELAKALYAVDTGGNGTAYSRLNADERAPYEREAKRMFLERRATADPDAARARFAELTKQYDEIDAKRTKLQLERDSKVDTHPEKDIRAYRDRIIKLHNEAAPIEEERAAISRALDGKTAA
jgi:hypothetical protein